MDERSPMELALVEITDGEKNGKKRTVDLELDHVDWEQLENSIELMVH